MSEQLTMIHITTDGSFTLNKEYRVVFGRNSFKLTCIKSSQSGYYFSTEKLFDEIEKFFNNGPLSGNLSTDNGVLNTSELIMKPLTFIKETLK